MAALFDRLLLAESGNRQLDKNGNPITSPRGAIGAAQVMPTTAPEAAKLAGVAFDDARYRTDADYNKTLGKAYLDAQLKAFGGDELKALAAYNAGAGRVKGALATAAKQGGSWMDYMPEETRNYVAKINPSKSLTPKSLVEGFGKTMDTSKPTGKSLIAGFAEFAKANPKEKGILEQAGDVVATAGRGALGLGETALTMGSAIIGAPLAGVSSLAQDITGTLPQGKTVKDVANERAAAMTYQPRTEEGKQSLGAIGDLMGNDVIQKILPAIPIAAEFQGAGTLGKAAAMPAVAATERAIAPVVAKAAAVVEPVIAKAGAMGDSAVVRALNAGKAAKSAVGKVADIIAPKPATPLPVSSGSVGSAATEATIQRKARAELLGFTDNAALTEGQITRDLPTQAFEGEVAKQAEGAPINARYTAQNEKIGQVIDNFIDNTGKQEPTRIEGGRVVVNALGDAAESAKNRVRALYKTADASDEALQPVTLDSLVSHLNNSTSDYALANNLGATRKELLRLGGAVEDEVGNLVARPVTLREGEKLRQFVTASAGNDAREIRQATIMKNLYDDATQGAGGKLFKDARSARAKFANDFENRAIVKNLINTKRGSDDRIVALEDVMNKTLLNGSKEDLSHLRKVLHTQGGEDGKQAWRELQGALLEHIKEKSTTAAKGEGVGAQMISSAALKKEIDALDRTGKLDFVFGKQGAQSMRDLRDIALDVKQFVPGAYNSSGTGAAIARMVMDSAVSGVVAGVPLPIATAIKAAMKYARGRDTQKRVTESLNYHKKF